MAGAGLTALFFVEILGFQKTLYIAAAGNFSIALTSFAISAVKQNEKTISQQPPVVLQEYKALNPVFIGTVLFVTGFCSMSLEVVWTRAFTPILKTTIYAFAAILVVYLLATWIGSFLYRQHLKKNTVWPVAGIINWLVMSSILPLILNDPRIRPKTLIVLASIFPFCLLLGYLTPQLIDYFSKGDSKKGGKVYAVNILGCILGPLFAGYILLPLAGVKWGFVVLSAPFLFIALYALSFSGMKPKNLLPIAFSAVLILIGIFVNRTYEDGDFYGNGIVRRDSTATVISHGEGLNKKLLVNGIGITHLTPITKIMAHFPLATLNRPPESGLVICFGMGTTFRSLLSWDIKAVAVELVPSVKEAFGFYFEDAESLVNNPDSEIIIDDGRRFLKRTGKKYDVITIDPPPPVEAAGSSLLYSKEFYDLVKLRLTDGGILQQWFPGGEKKILEAVAGTLKKEFRFVRAFHSIEGWGYHFLASEKPFEIPTLESMIGKMPDKAKKDLMEWYPGKTLEDIVSQILDKEVPLDSLAGSDSSVMITDDKPYNEYFFLRRKWAYAKKKYNALFN
jgi:predicted membrane-bound spermidine synthase